MSVAFWFRSGERFERIWQAARYYFLFIFCSAALWKISRGTVFINDQMANILKAEHAQYLFQHAATMQSSLLRYLIVHVTISHFLLIVYNVNFFIY